MIFLTESGLLGFVGGLVGVIIGVALALIAQLVAESNGLGIFKASFAPDLLVGALLLSFFVGAISGTLR